MKCHVFCSVATKNRKLQILSRGWGKNAVTEITQLQRKQGKDLIHNIQQVPKSRENLTQNISVIILSINEPYVIIKRQG